MVRRGLIDLLGSADDLLVVGEAATAEEALRRIPAARPDLALLDVRLPDGSGIDVCREIRSRFPEIRCLILTSFDDDEALFAAVMAGASGYLLKEIVGSSLLEDIRQVARGRSLLDPAIIQKLMQRLREPPALDPLIEALTPREREILDLIADALHQSSDRRAALPGREDREELRHHDPDEARHATAGTDCRLRRAGAEPLRTRRETSPSWQ